MKSGFRASMAWLHRWVGILFSAVMFFIFLTGTIGYFHYEIDRWMEPERPLAMQWSNEPSLDPDQKQYRIPSADGRVNMTQADLVQHGLNRLEELGVQDAVWWGVILPTARNGNLWIEWQPPRGADGQRQDRKAEYFSLENGSENWIQPRKTGGGKALYRLHWQLHYLPETAAYWLVGLCTLLMLVGLVSGVIIHRKIFRDFFTLRLFRHARSWLDFHNVTSVMALPFQLMIVYSGLVFFAVTFMQPIVTAHYGEDGERTFRNEAFPDTEAAPKAGKAAAMVPVVPLLEAAQKEAGEPINQLYVLYPGDQNARLSFYLHEASPSHYQGKPHKILYRASTGERIEGGDQLYGGAASVEKTLIALHEGLFADWGVRWLYIFSGLLGTLMIATGSLYWLKKRQLKNRFAYANVERFYAAVIAGLPIGIAAYFWANRLLSADWSGRMVWEMHSLFIIWGMTFVLAWLRPLTTLWREFFAFNAFAWGMIPIINALSTDRHLGISLAQGDWVLAGFDITAVVIAAGFGSLTLSKQRAQEELLSGGASLRSVGPT
ncbi:PepSY-associated TM helix domain-containing protein [Marinimicrobium agarilyticum]|uniref:PepSY-associated TM helix domain-containing protein n=1 Tax=Marinimicrobium agarilyticum TaxID=306546 RepID=UPI0003FBDA87|nr:PepSY-associated TM helix domain-containing protein [Marinimicrobium agarilyticum]